MGALKKKKIPTIPYPTVALGSQRSPHIIPNCEIWVRRDGSKDSSHLLELNLVPTVSSSLVPPPGAEQKHSPRRPPARTSQTLGAVTGKEIFVSESLSRLSEVLTEDE